MRARTLMHAAALALVLAGVGTAIAAPAPRLTITALDQLAKPLPLPYAESGDAAAEVAAARQRAKASGRKLLIDLGGNWCPDCRLLAGVMARPELAGWLKKHYEIVTVNIGRFDRNMAIPAHYGIKRPEGVPAILVVDPKTDKLVNAGHVTALADARSMTPQALADWLAQWV